MEYIDWTAILLDLIVTVIGFLFIPIFIRLLVGKLPTKKAKRIVIINAIIVQIIFIIIISGASDNPKVNFIPAIIWGGVGFSILDNGKIEDDNKKILCPYCNSKNNPKRERCYMCGKILIKNIDNNVENFNTNLNTEIKDIKEKNIENITFLYCGRCGAKNDIEDIYCTKCGNKLNK